MLEYVHYIDFLQRFTDIGRGDSFSEDGFFALYQYLEDLDPDYQLDVVEIDSSYYEIADGDTLESDDDDIVATFDGGAIVWNI